MTTMATHTGARAWNLNAQHRPVAVIMAGQADDVVEAVRLGREHDLGVGVMATGHGTSTANEGVLVNTSRMRASGSTRVAGRPACRPGRSGRR